MGSADVQRPSRLSRILACLPSSLVAGMAMGIFIAYFMAGAAMAGVLLPLAG